MAFRIGLTGGIGSGKSTVANLLAQLGAGVIDADVISRATTSTEGSAIAQIRADFGDAFIEPDGSLNREHMRQHVFNNPKAKQALEAIIHPLVGIAISEKAHMLTRAGSRCLIFDIPLLVESGRWRQSLERILVVDCSPETQVQRVCARSALTTSEVQKIMHTQASRLHRLAAADCVLSNDGISMQELACQVQEISLLFGL